MARDFIAVNQEAPLPLLPGAVEVLLVETTLLVESNTFGEIEDRQATWLVSFDPTPNHRRTARSIAAGLLSVYTSFEQAPDPTKVGEWLASLLSRRKPGATGIAISVPQHSAAVQEQIQLFIALTRGIENAPGLVVCVTENAGAWQTCSSLDGFVGCAKGECESTALKVFDLLNAMLAPMQYTCIDFQDLRLVFGPSMSPSVLVDGVWFPQHNTFKLGSDVETQLLSTCTALAVLPVGEMPGRYLSNMFREIRKTLEHVEDLVLSAPYRLLSDAVSYKSIIRVVLLVRRD